MVTATLTRQIADPARSHRSGLNPSTTCPTPTSLRRRCRRTQPRSAEVRIRLSRGDKPVRGKRNDAGTDERHPTMLTDALPDQPGPANLRHCGDGEQQHRTKHGRHQRTPTSGPSAETSVRQRRQVALRQALASTLGGVYSVAPKPPTPPSILGERPLNRWGRVPQRSSLPGSRFDVSSPIGDIITVR